ncbi:MAG TPA: hypothetical protein VJB91_03100 [Patescibacteria group bacterium]|nr:hypothetical protein [Patescibacteria group bacterium]
MIFMTETAHTLVGVAIASRIPNPYISLPLVFASHLVLDLVPHWDAGTHYKNKTKLRLTVESGIDVLLSVAVPYLLFGNTMNPYLFAGAVFVSQLPDWLEMPHLFLRWKFFPFTAWAKFHSTFHRRKALPWGAINQVVVVTLLLLFLGNI